MASPRIVSLLPSATELACALGLEPHIVGISFECDYPASITDRPRVVSATVDTHNMTPREIDEAVRSHMKSGNSLYAIDEKLLAGLKPDIILTQDLCQVCAPSGNELSQALRAFNYTPQIVFMSPHTLFDIEQNVRELAAVTGREAAADTLIAGWHRRRRTVEERVAKQAYKPRVFVMEWVDPIFCAGHWLGEMITVAGGRDSLARPGEDSVRVDWQHVVEWQPEVLIVAPCGYNQEQAQAQLGQLASLPGWETLPAVRSGRVHAVDANACFVRPGARVIDGLEMLCGLFGN